MVPSRAVYFHTVGEQLRVNVPPDPNMLWSDKGVQDVTPSKGVGNMSVAMPTLTVAGDE